MSELNDTQIDENQEENDESTPLLITQIPQKSFFRRHKRCTIFCLAAFFVILAVALTIYFGYFHGIVSLKVFAFNVWGMPGKLMEIYYCELSVRNNKNLKKFSFALQIFSFNF